MASRSMRSRDVSPISFRRLSRTSSSHSLNGDVFSDVHAIESYNDDHASRSPSLEFSHEELTLGTPYRDEAHPTSTVIYPAIPNRLSTRIRPNSIAKTTPHLRDSSSTPHRAVSFVSQLEPTTQRSLSTASRLSIPRTQSPYVGPTAPSHPYGMYTQMTRASSVASASTFRHVERPFTGHPGPEHPYSMYPQNTVTGDDDGDIGGIPLGFPGMGGTYNALNGNELGDIVGPDGHIENLPPYTRYADNVVAKGDMREVDGEETQPDVQTPLSQQRTLRSESNVAINLGATRTAGVEQEEQDLSRRARWKKKSKKPICCGLPLWTALLLALLIAAAAVLGGVVGGVVGNKQGINYAGNSAATTTVWLDAQPVATQMTACPTGHFYLPLNQSIEENSCVTKSELSGTWTCIDMPVLGISVFENDTTHSVHFDDYSLITSQLRYGPQPPDFNGTTFDLAPFNDKDNSSLGVAMFFSVLFNKLVILPEGAISPGPDKREVAAHSTPWDRQQTLNIADKPWFCYWNETINEFWIFVEQEAATTGTYSPFAATTSGAPPPPPPSSSPQPPIITSAPSSLPPYWATIPSSPPSAYQPPPTTLSTSASTSSNAMYASVTNQPSQSMAVPRMFKRDDTTPEYPLLVKMVEKRKPNGNIGPYCQQMQVLNDWQVMPIPDIPTVAIPEVDYSPAAATTGSGSKKRWEDMGLWEREVVERAVLGKRKNHRKQRDSSKDSSSQLESYCVCEWMST